MFFNFQTATKIVIESSDCSHIHFDLVFSEILQIDMNWYRVADFRNLPQSLPGIIFPLTAKAYPVSKCAIFIIGVFIMWLGVQLTCGFAKYKVIPFTELHVLSILGFLCNSAFS